MSDTSSFPVIDTLNKYRTILYEQYHPKKDEEQPTLSLKIKSWLGHKALTVACIPANTLGAIGGAVSSVLSGTTVGALKVAVYAGTLGNVKPQFPSGLFWFGQKGANSLAQIASNTYEMIEDTKDAAILVKDRLLKGLESASKMEHIDFPLESQLPFSYINDLTAKKRINNKAEERNLSDMVQHAGLSALNIPLNIGMSAVTGLMTIASATAFVSKAAFFALTNVEIPVKTYTLQSTYVTGKGIENAVIDLYHDAKDTFVGIYKISKAVTSFLNIGKAVATAGQVIRFIPEAIFS